MAVHIRYNNVYAFCSGSVEELSEVAHILTYAVKGAKYACAFREGRWNGKKTFFHRGLKSFPIGLYGYLVSKLKNIEFELEDRRPEFGTPEENEIVLWNEKTGEPLELRDYQKEAVSAFQAKGRGIIKLSTRAGKCCQEGTLVRTTKGWKKIEEIEVEDEVKTLTGAERVFAIHDMGEEETVIIDVNSVYSIGCTSEHPLLTVVDGKLEWKEACSLKTGDFVCLGRQTSLICGEDDPVSRLLGYLVADGGLSVRSSIVFTNDNSLVKEDFRNILKSLQITWREEDNNENGSVNFHLHGGEKLREWLKTLGLDLVLSRHKSVPSYVLKRDSRTREFLRAYLSCEGCFSTNKKEFTFSSSSKTLINEICTLLLGFGIACVGRTKNINGHNYYEARVLRTCTPELLSLELLTDRSSLLPPLSENGNYTNVDTVPTTGYLKDVYELSPYSLSQWRSKLGKWGTDAYFYGKRFPSYKKLTEIMSVPGIDFPTILQEILESKPFFGKVTRIEKNKGRVYDLTLPQFHHYIGNGFYSHNTAIGIACTQWIGLKTLFIVHTKDLLKQTAAEYKRKMKVDVGVIGDGEWETKHITVSTVQSLSRALKDPARQQDAQKFLEEIQFVIFDEVHRASISYQEVSRALKNCWFRLGLSATALVGDKENKLQSMSIVGHIIYEVKAERLIEKKQIAKPLVFFINVPYEKYVGEEWNEIYANGIVLNETRNQMICDAALKMLNKGKESLVLVEKLEHGYVLEELLRDKCKCAFIHGGHSSQQRETAIVDLQRGALDVCIASRIWNEGIDLPHLESVIIGSGWKSPILTYQRLGRGITKTEKKIFTTVVDFIDCQHRLLRKHSDERLDICLKEKGFEVHVLESIDEL